METWRIRRQLYWRLSTLWAALSSLGDDFGLGTTSLWGRRRFGDDVALGTTSLWGRRRSLLGAGQVLLRAAANNSHERPLDRWASLLRIARRRFDTALDGDFDAALAAVLPGTTVYDDSSPRSNRFAAVLRSTWPAVTTMGPEE